MRYLSIRTIHKEEKGHYKRLYISLLLIASFSLSLIALALMPIASSLDKPIPTGSVDELVAYAGKLLMIAALIVCCALSLLLTVRTLLRAHSEYKAKMISTEIINRIAAMANGKEAAGLTSSLRVDLHG